MAAGAIAARAARLPMRKPRLRCRANSHRSIDMHSHWSPDYSKAFAAKVGKPPDGRTTRSTSIGKSAGRGWILFWRPVHLLTMSAACRGGSLAAGRRGARADHQQRRRQAQLGSGLFWRGGTAGQRPQLALKELRIAGQPRSIRAIELDEGEDYLFGRRSSRSSRIQASTADVTSARRRRSRREGQARRSGAEQSVGFPRAFHHRGEVHRQRRAGSASNLQVVLHAGGSFVIAGRIGTR